MTQDPEVLIVPSIAADQPGIPAVARQVLDAFDAEADRRSRRREYRMWLSEIHAETFSGEFPPEDVPDILVRLRIAYAIGRDAIERNGMKMSPRFEQNFEAAMAMNEELFTSTLRSMVEREVARTPQEATMTMAKKATAAAKPRATTTTKKAATAKADGEKKPRAGEVLFEILSRKTVPPDREILAEIKDRVGECSFTTRPTLINHWMNRYAQGLYPGHIGETSGPFNQPKAGEPLGARSRKVFTKDELAARKKIHVEKTSGKTPAKATAKKPASSTKAKASKPPSAAKAKAAPPRKATAKKATPSRKAAAKATEPASAAPAAGGFATADA